MNYRAIFWNLPSHLPYTPGTVLSVIVFLSNPDVIPRSYSLILRVLQNGQVVSEDPITIDGEPAITVQAGGTEILYEALVVAVTHVALGLVVIDATTGMQIDAATTFLSGEPAVPPNEVLGAMPALAGLLMIGAVAGEIMS